MAEKDEIITTTEFAQDSFQAPGLRTYNHVRNFMVVLLLIEVIALLIGCMV